MTGKKPSAPCPVCASAATRHFLARRGVPVHQNQVFETESAAQKMARGDLELYVCGRCGFIFNRAFDSSLLSYGDYDCCQMSSSFYDEHFKTMTRYLVDRRGLKNKKVLEIGCGHGHFLKAVCETGSNEGFGFDPSYSGPQIQGRVRFVRGLFSPGAAPPADAVICRQVIDHVYSPKEFFRMAHASLKDSPDARFFIETPDVEWILKNGVFWDLFYEHLSYFSKHSLAAALALTGFKVVGVRPVLEDQYLWVESAKMDAGEKVAEPAAHELTELAASYAAQEKQLIERWGGELKELGKRGKVAVWGAGAKGNTFLNLIDPDRGLVDCVVDLYPKKQGKFIAGTGHPIVGFERLPDRGVRTAVLMNPNYRTENEALLRKAGISLALIDQCQVSAR